MDKVRTVGIVFLLLSISACGGGDSSNPPDNFTISSSSVTFNASPGGPIPAPQIVTGSIVNVSSPIYLFVTSPGIAIADASVVLTGSNSGLLTLFPKTPSALGTGTFTETVTLRACLDSGCTQQVSGSPKSISVTYNIVGIAASPASINLTAIEGSTSDPVLINITNASGTSAWTTSVSYGAGAAGWLNIAPVSGSSNAPLLTVSGGPLSSGSAGTYTATIAVQSGTYNVNIPVSYSVAAPSLTASPSNPTFTIDPTSTSASSFIQRVVATSSTGASLDWIASSSAPWLAVTPSGVSGQVATLSLVPAQLAALRNGQSSATITFTYNGPGVANSILTLPVALNLSLPAVSHVAPHVVFTNNVTKVTLRGEGFTGAIASSVRFGTQSATSISVISDSEIEATLPTLGVGTYVTSVVNPLGVNRSTSTLLVKQPLTFSSATLPSSIRKNRLIFDAERQNLYAVSDSHSGGGQVERYHYSGNAWTKLTSLVLPQLNGAALSTDGSTLYVVTDTKLYSVDLKVEPLVATPIATNPSAWCGYYWASVGVANNGVVMIVGDYTQCNGFPDLYLYDATATPALAVSAAPYQPRSAMTPDNGSRIYTSFGQSYLDASDQMFKSMSVSSGYFYNTPVTRTGSKILLNGNRLVYDNNFNVLGATSKYTSQAATISPDGTKAYVLADPYSSASLVLQDSISVSDLMAPLEAAGSPFGASFPEISRIPITQAVGKTLYNFDGLLVSPDGKALFATDADDIYVIPLP